jgi:hypothetical protein
MLSPISIWATFSTRRAACKRRIQTYKMALQLAPTYADAHYNLALAYEKLREPRKALNTGRPISSSTRRPVVGACPQSDRSKDSAGRHA